VDGGGGGMPLMLPGPLVERVFVVVGYCNVNNNNIQRKIGQPLLQRPPPRRLLLAALVLLSLLVVVVVHGASCRMLTAAGSVRSLAPRPWLAFIHHPSPPSGRRRRVPAHRRLQGQGALLMASSGSTDAGGGGKPRVIVVTGARGPSQRQAYV
jgi:hypothetical protein